MEMDMRKMRILQAIIDDYILTATPVGSRTVSKNSDISLSSATIRNVMADLEDMGYLEQPHTSAGRIPSERAYRLYVNSIMQRAMLSDDERKFIKSCYSNTISKVDDVIKQTAWVLSSMTKYTSMVLAPQVNAIRLKHIQLVPVSEGKALAVVITDAGITRDSIIRIPRGTQPDELEQISRILTARLKNKHLDEINEITLPELYKDLEGQRTFLNDAIETVRKSMGSESSVELSGATNMLNFPEYSDMERARSFLSVIDSKDMLQRMLTEATKVEFSITIGGENPSEDMKDCSVVTATYRIGDNPLGSLGVIGPTRMNYSRVLAVLGHIGKSLSEMLTNMFDEEHE